MPLSEKNLFNPETLCFDLATFTSFFPKNQPMNDQEISEFYNFLGNYTYFFQPIDEKNNDTQKPFVEIALYQERLMLPNPLFIRPSPSFDWFNLNDILDEYFLISTNGPCPTQLKIVPAVLHPTTRTIKKRGSIELLTPKD